MYLFSKTIFFRLKIELLLLLFFVTKVLKLKSIYLISDSKGFSLGQVTVKCFKQLYYSPTRYIFLDQKRKTGLIKKIKKQINKFEITGDVLGIVTT